MRKSALERSNDERQRLGLPPLMSRAAFDRLSPRAQGYASYMQSSWPGSPLPDCCPYPAGSAEAQAWAQGEQSAIINAQDMEE